MATEGNHGMESSGEDSEEDREVERILQSEADGEEGERPSSTLLQSSGLRDPFPHPEREVSDDGVRDLHSALGEPETQENAGAAGAARRTRSGPGGHTELEVYWEGGKKRFRSVRIDEAGNRVVTPFNHDNEVVMVLTDNITHELSRVLNIASPLSTADAADEWTQAHWEAALQIGADTRGALPTTNPDNTYLEELIEREVLTLDTQNKNPDPWYYASRAEFIPYKGINPQNEMDEVFAKAPQKFKEFLDEVLKTAGRTITNTDALTSKTMDQDCRNVALNVARELSDIRRMVKRMAQGQEIMKSKIEKLSAETKNYLPKYVKKIWETDVLNHARVQMTNLEEVAKLLTERARDYDAQREEVKARREQAAALNTPPRTITSQTDFNKYKPQKVKLSSSREEFDRFVIKADAYIKIVGIQLSEPCIQEEAIKELYDERFWTKIMEEKRRDRLQDNAVEEFLDWDAISHRAGRLYKSYNDMTSKTATFTAFLTNFLLKLKDRKKFTFDGTKDKTEDIYNSMTLLTTEIAKTEAEIWNRPPLVAAIITYAMADDKLREEYLKEMKRSVWIRKAEDNPTMQTDIDHHNYYRKGASLNPYRGMNKPSECIYPCIDVITKVLDTRLATEARARNNALAWGKSNEGKMVHVNFMGAAGAAAQEEAQGYQGNKPLHHSRFPGCYTCGNDGHYGKDCNISREEAMCTWGPCGDKKGHLIKACKRRIASETNTPDQPRGASGGRSGPESRETSRSPGRKEESRGRKAVKTRIQTREKTRSRSRSKEDKKDKKRKPARATVDVNHMEAASQQEEEQQYETEYETEESADESADDAAASASRRDPTPTRGGGATRRARKNKEVSCFLVQDDDTGERTKECLEKMKRLPRLDTLIWAKSRKRNGHGAHNPSRRWQQYGPGEHIKALADTGCSHPIISGKMAERMDLEVHRYGSPQETTTVQLGDGNRVPAAGFTYLWLNTKKRSTNPRRRVKAIVLPGLPHEMLIGFKTPVSYTHLTLPTKA